MTNLELMEKVMHELATINAAAFQTLGELPATLVLASAGKGVSVMPLEAIESADVRREMSGAAFVLTVVEGYMLDRRTSDSTNRESVANNPDARLCMMYLAQARDGTRACAVQYILRPEHGKPALAPLKVINAADVGFLDADDSDSNATRH